MADNFAVTPGAGLIFGSDDVAGVHMQRVKPVIGGDGVAVDMPGDALNGVDVDVTRVQGTVAVSAAAALPVSDNGGSLTIDGTVTATALPGAPVHVRLSNGTAAIDTLPVSAAAALPVNDNGGSLTVDGTVTAIQGTKAAIGGAWPVQLTDGVGTVALVGDALKVTGTVTLGGTQLDKAAFTEGTSPIAVIGGVVNDTIVSAPAEDTAAALRLTPRRGLHVSLRRDDGVEVATAGVPLRTDPTGSTIQPVSGVVTANQGGAPWAVQQSSGVQVRVDKPFTASQAAQDILAPPTSGKVLFVCGIIISVTGSGPVTIYDQTDSATTRLYNGTPPISVVVIPFGVPQRLAAVNNILRYTTGSGSAGNIQAYGYEI